MADVTAVYSINDTDALKALNRIERRFDKHARETPKKMTAATDAMSMGFIKSAITGAAAFKVITTGIRFATDAIREYAKTSPMIAQELEATSAAWDRFTNSIGRDLALLTVGSSGPIEELLINLESARVKLRDFYSDYYRFVGGLVGIPMGDGDPTAALIEDEAKAGQEAIRRRAKEGERSLTADFDPDSLTRVRARANATFESEMTELAKTRVGDRQATRAELDPLISLAEARRDMTIQREQDRIAAEAKKKSDQELTEFRRTSAERRKRQTEEETAVMQAERSVDFLEKSAKASELRAAGLEREADALEILTAAEKDLIDIRENENLGAGSKARGERAILSSARADLDRLGMSDGSRATSGATIGAGLGGSLASRVFGVVGPSGNAETRKIIDTAKAQLVELKGLRQDLRRPAVAVFAP